MRRSDWLAIPEPPSGVWFELDREVALWAECGACGFRWMVEENVPLELELECGECGRARLAREADRARRAMLERRRR